MTIDIIKNFGLWFLLNLFYNGNLYYLLWCCTYPIFGKNIVPDVSAKILSANQTVAFLNDLYFQNKSIKSSDFFKGWFKFKKVRICSDIFWVGIVKNVSGQFGHKALKLTVSQ